MWLTSPYFCFISRSTPVIWSVVTQFLNLRNTVVCHKCFVWFFHHFHRPRMITVSPNQQTPQWLCCLSRSVVFQHCHTVISENSVASFCEHVIRYWLWCSCGWYWYNICMIPLYLPQSPIYSVTAVTFSIASKIIKAACIYNLCLHICSAVNSESGWLCEMSWSIRFRSDIFWERWGGWSRDV